MPKVTTLQLRSDGTINNVNTHLTLLPQNRILINLINAMCENAMENWITRSDSGTTILASDMIGMIAKDCWLQLATCNRGLYLLVHGITFHFNDIFNREFHGAQAVEGMPYQWVKNGKILTILPDGSMPITLPHVWSTNGYDHFIGTEDHEIESSVNFTNTYLKSAPLHFQMFSLEDIVDIEDVEDINVTTYDFCAKSLFICSLFMFIKYMQKSMCNPQLKWPSHLMVSYKPWENHYSKMDKGDLEKMECRLDVLWFKKKWQLLSLALAAKTNKTDCLNVVMNVLNRRPGLLAELKLWGRHDQKDLQGFFPTGEPFGHNTGSKLASRNAAIPRAI